MKRTKFTKDTCKHEQRRANSGGQLKNNFETTVKSSQTQAAAVVQPVLFSVFTYGTSGTATAQATPFIAKPFNEIFSDCALATAVASAVNKKPTDVATATDLASITRLSASNKGITDLSGIGVLTNLTTLDLGGNKVKSIPAEIGNLTKLQLLSLYNNQTTGNIPAELGNLTALTGVQLSYNKLTGNIPAELGNLTCLDWLYLSSNLLTGDVPAELTKLENLTWLKLSDNQLTSIPPEVYNMAVANYPKAPQTYTKQVAAGVKNTDYALKGFPIFKQALAYNNPALAFSYALTKPGTVRLQPTVITPEDMDEGGNFTIRAAELSAVGVHTLTATAEGGYKYVIEFQVIDQVWKKM